MNRDGASVALLAASQGIRKTDPSQYGRFTQDIAAAGNDTIIFVTDKTPSDYPSAAEGDYFRAILNKYVQEGKTQLVIGIGCTGGKHRSVTLANELYEALQKNDNYGIRIEHRDIGKDAITKAR